MDNQKRTAVISALFEKKNKRKPKNSKELLDFVKSQGGDEFLKKVDEYITLAEKEQANQAKKAAHGTKLNFIRSLKHQCADDEELYYYKKGGSIGCGCKKKKKEDGGEITKAKSGTVVDKFKNRRPVPNLPTLEENPGSTKQPMLDALKRKYHKNDYSSKTIKESQKDYDKGKGDHEVKKCGGKVKKDCGGSKLKACNGAVAKYVQKGGIVDTATELIPVYGTYKIGLRFVDNPTWEGAAELGVSALGDLALVTGVGTGAGLALKAAKAAKAAKTARKISSAARAAKAEKAGRYYDASAQSFDYATNLYGGNAIIKANKNKK